MNFKSTSNKVILGYQCHSRSLMCISKHKINCSDDSDCKSATESEGECQSESENQQPSPDSTAGLTLVPYASSSNDNEE